MLPVVPEVAHVVLPTVRAELDEHAENVNFSVIDLGLVEPERRRPGALLRANPDLRKHGVERAGRPRGVGLAEIRDTLPEMPGVFPTSASRSCTGWTSSCPASAPG